MWNFNNIFPFTNFHELNLDWVLQQVKKAVKSINGVEPDDSGEVTLTPADIGAIPPEQGLPAGGNANDILIKSSAADYAAGWNLPLSKLRGTDTKYVTSIKNGNNTFDIDTVLEEYHGFMFNCVNTPTQYGFLNVTHFVGTGFTPSNTGVWLQEWVDYTTEERFTRIRKNLTWSGWDNPETYQSGETLNVTGATVLGVASGTGTLFGGSITLPKKLPADLTISHTVTVSWIRGAGQVTTGTVNAVTRQSANELTITFNIDTNIGAYNVVGALISGTITFT